MGCNPAQTVLTTGQGLGDQMPTEALPLGGIHGECHQHPTKSDGDPGRGKADQGTEHGDQGGPGDSGPSGFPRDRSPRFASASGGRW